MSSKEDVINYTVTRVRYLIIEVYNTKSRDLQGDPKIFMKGKDRNDIGTEGNL